MSAEDAENLGYFWRTAGATRFSEGGAPAAGYASTVVVADRFGVVIFSDLQGNYRKGVCGPARRQGQAQCGAADLAQIPTTTAAASTASTSLLTVFAGAAGAAHYAVAAVYVAYTQRLLEAASKESFKRCAATAAWHACTAHLSRPVSLCLC